MKKRFAKLLETEWALKISVASILVIAAVILDSLLIMFVAGIVTGKQIGRAHV